MGATLCRWKARESRPAAGVGVAPLHELDLWRRTGRMGRHQRTGILGSLLRISWGAPRSFAKMGAEAESLPLETRSPFLAPVRLSASVNRSVGVDRLQYSGYINNRGGEDGLLSHGQQTCPCDVSCGSISPCDRKSWQDGCTRARLRHHSDAQE